MPELPEVETTLRGITPLVMARPIETVVVRDPRLRWPVPAELPERLRGKTVRRTWRRGKYLLLEFESGTLLVHLGMSGSLRSVPAATPPQAHDHVDIRFADGTALRFRDPRRFGCMLWLAGDPLQHPLLNSLGPEPLSSAFDGDVLFARSRGRRQAVKSFVMDGTVVVGVGNIYANEALFRAGISPHRQAGRISRQRYAELAKEIRAVLQDAITVGGTTLRDFAGGDGAPGYFRQSLQVYGRGGEPCRVCDTPLKETRLGQRTTVHCPHCQR